MIIRDRLRTLTLPLALTRAERNWMLFNLSQPLAENRLVVGFD
jgi:hypothetical protein